MKPWLAKLLLGALLAIPLLAILIGPVSGAAEMRLTATVRPTDTRWPTLTLRPTDTRWPTKTPLTPVTVGPTKTRTPTATRAPTKTITPTLTRRPTDTRWPTATRIPSRTPTLPATPGPLVQSPNIRQVHMIDARNGWAIGDTYLMRTLDGGFSWFNVSPQGMTLTGIGASGYFLTANSGWLLTSLANNNLGTLFRTTDGGRTWTAYDVPFSNGQVQFLSANTGFVMTSLGAGMSKQAVAIYQSTNGGATWTRKYINDPTVTGAANTLPLGGQKSGMAFRDIWRGWIGGNYPSPGYTYLYVTDNSGAAWKQVLLPLPSGYSGAFVTMKAPIFFGPFNAILPVSLVNGSNSDLYIYVTNDAGYKWVTTGFVRNGELPYTDFVTLNDGFVWDWSGKLHVTHNAGVTWTEIIPNVDFTTSLRQLDFVSTTTGWAVEIYADGSTALHQTTDGGRTWNLLTASQLPPTPGPSSTPTATIAPTATSTRTPTSVPTVTVGPTATLTTGPFGVVLVKSNDSLNIRSGPGVSYPIVGMFEYTETSVTRTGSVSGSGRDLWYQVQNPGGGTGWVNSFYLTEYIRSDTFCADARISQLIARLKQAVNTSDGKLFASLVSPIHGVDVRLWHYTTPINYTPAGAAEAFTSATVQNWGAGASGIDTTGTFASVIQPKLQDVMNAPTYAALCNDPEFASMFYEPWPGEYTNFNYYSLVRPGTPGVDLDYRQWMVGLEYVRGQPYLVAFIHIVWEP